MKGKYIEALDRECLQIHSEITDARRPLYQVNESLSFYHLLLYANGRCTRCYFIFQTSTGSGKLYKP